MDNILAKREIKSFKIGPLAFVLVTMYRPSASTKMCFE